jgi:molybdate/tungstate transport system substrate-binding protein
VSKTIKAILVLLTLGLLVAAVTAKKQLGIQSSKLKTGASKLVIFHAGSLAVPLKRICEEFSKHYPDIEIVREAAGSRVCARKIAELNRLCDVMVSADYTIIDTLLIPEYAEWNIKFATNEMVIAFRRDSRRAAHINKNNWYDILLEKDVTFGRSDPDADPCGYRSVLTMILAEKFYSKAGLAESILTKDRRYIRPKEVDLLALLEVGELDYIFIYRSVAEQHKLQIVRLPDQVNLRKTEFADFYKTAYVRVTGKRPGAFITKTGEPIVYGITILKNAPNRELALKFLTFLLDVDKGGAILEKDGQTLVVPSPTDTFEKLPECLKTFALPLEQEIRREVVVWN